MLQCSCCLPGIPLPCSSFSVCYSCWGSSIERNSAPITWPLLCLLQPSWNLQTEVKLGGRRRTEGEIPGKHLARQRGERLLFKSLKFTLAGLGVPKCEAQVGKRRQAAKTCHSKTQRWGVGMGEGRGGIPGRHEKRWSAPRRNFLKNGHHGNHYVLMCSALNMMEDTWRKKRKGDCTSGGPE